MKHELLYETNDSFIQKEGNGGKVTSIVPGMAYIKDVEESKYNNLPVVLTMFYDITDVSATTKIFASDSIKNGLIEVVIEKNKISPSELTQEYQFTETGKNAVKFVYSNLTAIPENAFSGCTSLCGFKLPKTVKNFGNTCFGNTGISNAVIPQQITSCGNGIFRNCQLLETAMFDPDISNIYCGFIFDDCTNLKKVVLGEKIINFGGTSQSSGFCTDTPKLGEVVFPPSLVHLGGSYPFATETYTRCDIYFTSIAPPELSNNITQNYFRNRKNVRIYVPEESLEEYKAAPYFTNESSKIYPIPSDWDNPYE